MSSVVNTQGNAGLGGKVGFDYGASRERIRRLDYAASSAVSAQTVTHFVGSAEVRYSASGTNQASMLQELRRYVGGTLVVQRRVGTTKTIARQYLLTDAQGSTWAVLDDYGMPVNASASMSFTPFGARRSVANWTDVVAPSTTLSAELKDTTRHGYTGHEQVDEVGIVHMNGRIYDPQLGRFLQADPYVQSPGNSQSLNRYSYVFNNPMAHTDPTGYWGARQQGYLRTAAAIVVSIYTGNAAATAWAGHRAALPVRRTCSQI